MKDDCSKEFGFADLIFDSENSNSVVKSGNRKRIIKYRFNALPIEESTFYSETEHHLRKKEKSVDQIIMSAEKNELEEMSTGVTYQMIQLEANLFGTNYITNQTNVGIQKEY